MRIHRVALRDVKGVRECELTVPDAGVVVLEGPNEAGKSTVVEALDLLLDPRARATSRAARVRALQPVGRDVGPCVEAELTLAGHRVRFCKQWLRQPRTELEVLSPAREVMAGDAAQQRFDALLEQGLDRQLWEALRFLQSGGPLVGGLCDSDALTRALDAAAGADLHSDQGESLLGTVDAEYERYFTPTGRPARELKEALHGAQRARDVAADRHRAVQDVERMSERHEELSARLTDAQGQRAGLVDHRDAAIARADEAAEALRALESAKAAARERGEAVTRAEREVERRDRVSKRAEQLTARVAQAEADLLGVQQRAADQERARVAARAAVEGARRDEEESAEHLARAERLEGYARARERSRAVTEALDADAEAAEEVAQLEEQSLPLQERLAALAAATPERCEQARLAEQEAELLAEESRRSAARWQLQPSRDDVTVEVGGDPVTVRGSSPVEGALEAETVVEAPGVLRLVLRPGEAEQARSERVERARTRLSRLLADAGVGGVDELAARVDERQQVTAELDRLRGRAARLDEGPVLAAEQRADLEREARQLEVELESSGQAGEPADSGEAEDPGTPSEHAHPAAALKQVRAARAEERRRRSARQQADVALAEAEQHHSELRLAVERARAVLEQGTGQREEVLAELAEARAERDDDALRAELTDARAAAERAGQQVAGARQRVADSGAAGAATALEEAREALARHDRELQQLRAERDRLAGQLELVLGEGRQEELDRALADLEHARQQLDSVSRRARAVRHLRVTLLRHRESAQQAYARPYTAAVEALGREVYGEGFAVEVADDLRVVARVLEGVRVPVEQLSGGAQEQLGVLCRLAVAGLVDRADGVPVVLDDAFGFTDPQRLAEIVRVLGAASRGAQVLLLTCVPERVAGLEGASRVSLRPTG